MQGRTYTQYCYSYFIFVFCPPNLDPRSDSKKKEKNTVTRPPPSFHGLLLQSHSFIQSSFADLLLPPLHSVFPLQKRVPVPLSRSHSFTRSLGLVLALSLSQFAFSNNASEISSQTPASPSPSLRNPSVNATRTADVAVIPSTNTRSHEFRDAPSSKKELNTAAASRLFDCLSRYLIHSSPQHL